MTLEELPFPIRSYFESGRGEATAACFVEDATVWDNGEDKVLHGIGAIREWLSKDISQYNLRTQLNSASEHDGEVAVGAVVSGDFPGSPYEFSYRFRLEGERIKELAIDPIGPVEQ